MLAFLLALLLASEAVTLALSDKNTTEFLDIYQKYQRIVCYR